MRKDVNMKADQEAKHDSLRDYSVKEDPIGRKLVEYDPEEFGLDETDNVRIYEHHRIRVDPGQEAARIDMF